MDINFYNKINIYRFIDRFTLKKSVGKFTYNQFTDKFCFRQKSIGKYDEFWVFSRFVSSIILVFFVVNMMQNFVFAINVIFS